MELLVDITMPYKPGISFDSEHGVWSSKSSRGFFVPELSLGEIIFNEMRRHQKLIAQVSVSENTVLTRGQLLQNSMRVASYMRSLGIDQLDIVGIAARNTTHISAVAYACLFNGTPFHAININYEEEVVTKLFETTKPRLIFCDGDEYEKVKAATAKLDARIITMRNHATGSISIDEVLATPAEVDFEPRPLQQGSNHTLAILCSSGTTGTPKAVTITHNLRLLDLTPHLTTDDVQYTQGSLDWITGISATVTSGVYSTKRVISDKPFDPTQLLRVIEEHKVTWILQASSHLAMVVNCAEFDKTNLDSIRYYLFGGSTSSVEVQQRLRSRLRNGFVLFAYGLSETGFVSVNWHHDEKPNSTGRPREGYKVKILNEQGCALGPKQVGEVCTSSGAPWPGYFGNAEETRKALDAQMWFLTGDLGYVDDDGFLYIVDRKKDLLKYQINNYLPRDIEEIISQMPGVAEVCVFGIWDQFNGDAAAAAVVRQIGSEISAQDVLDYVQRNIKATYKHLHGGAIIVDALKCSANGKTNRRATKEYFLELTGNK
ncbi:hypothetical protein KR222_007589, partial [Zaprionus bogoriensis]